MSRFFRKLIRLDEAKNIIRSYVSGIDDTEEIHIRDSLGRIIAEDIIADKDIPPFNRSAMDGFAVRAEDIIFASSENPAVLDIIGESEIGKPFDGILRDRSAVYVHTGSMIPLGADTVVPVEYTRIENRKLYVFRSVSPNANISFKGEDIKKGTKILKKGTKIEAFDVAIMKALGIKKVNVFRKPIVAIFACGSELVDNIEKLEHGKLLEYSREIVMGIAKKFGCDVVDAGIVPDEEEEIVEKILGLSENVDIIVTVGGTSIGKHDLIPRIIEKYGVLLFHGVSIQPGRPVCAGKISKKIIVGLPGLPVATFIATITILKKVIEIASNVNGEIFLPRIKAKLKRHIWSKPGIRTFARVKLKKEDGYIVAEPLLVSGSGVLSSLVMGNGIVEIPEEDEGIESGKVVDVLLLRNIVSFIS